MMQAKKFFLFLYFVYFFLNKVWKKLFFSHIIIVILFADGLFKAFLDKEIKQDVKNLSGEVYCSSHK